MEKEMAQLDGAVLHTSWNQSGLRMAAVLSDASLQLWDASADAADSDRLTLTAQWEAGVGGCCPKVVWAPSEYGDILASCSTAGVVSLWEEVIPDGKKERSWRHIASLNAVQSSVLDMQFSNASTGLYFLVVSADGYARIYHSSDILNLVKWQLQSEFQNSKTAMEINAKHSFLGASVAWRSPISTNLQPAFVFGCNSTSSSLNVAKVWEFEQSHQRWSCVAELREADEKDKPVNHTSWAPNIGRSYEMIAIAVGDGISIWQVKFLVAGQERCSVRRVARLTGFDKEVWQVEWDTSGMTLASSGSDGIVRLWQANLKGEWQQSTQIQ